MLVQAFDKPLETVVVESAKTRVFFCDFCGGGDRSGRGANSRFFAASAVRARPSAGIGVVGVAKLRVCCGFCGLHAALCGDRRGRGAIMSCYVTSCHTMSCHVMLRHVMPSLSHGT